MEHELYHWGIKGMKWGIRRYQNKDGSLTKAGQKRYNKEMEELKGEQKVLKSKLRTRKKIDKLKSTESENEDLKKTLKDKESVEEKRARLLKSTDAKELYKNKDLLTDSELNERINRIDLENRLQSKIVVEHTKTGLEKFNEKMQKGADTVNNVTNMFKKVDDAYSAVSKSAIGKTLAKKLGLEPPKKEFNIDEIWKKRNSLSDDDLRKAANRVQSEANLKRNMDALSGKNTNKNNNSGMSESDMEDMINRILDERGDGGN